MLRNSDHTAHAHKTLAAASTPDTYSSETRTN